MKLVDHWYLKNDNIVDNPDANCIDPKDVCDLQWESGEFLS